MNYRDHRITCDRSTCHGINESDGRSGYQLVSELSDRRNEIFGIKSWMDPWNFRIVFRNVSVRDSDHCSWRSPWDDLYDLYMIRETNDVSLSNKKRALMANESGSDILLRIHCNSADSQSANGALTMSPTLSNPYCRSIAADSQELSECVVSTLCRRTGAVNRGVTQTDEMTGINWSKIPVTIVEMGFMSNPEEDQKLSDNHYQAMIAEGIADGVDRYYERRGEKNEEK